MQKIILLLSQGLIASLVLGQAVNFAEDGGAEAGGVEAVSEDSTRVAAQNGTQNRLIPITGNSGIDSAIGGGVLGFGLGIAGSLLAESLNPCGRKKRQADGTSNRFFLGGGGSSPCRPQQQFNPCGRRKRQAADGEATSNRFFLGGNNNNNNCGPVNQFPQQQNFNQFPQQQSFNQFPQQQGFNQFPQQQNFNQFPQQQGFNQFPQQQFQQQQGFSPVQQQQGFNQFQQQPAFSPLQQQQQGFNQFQQQQGFNQFQPQQAPQFNSGSCKCQCSNLSFTENGQVQGRCQSRDETGRAWCYTTGLDNNCRDLQTSQRFPNNPWSYNACSNQC